MNLCWNKGANSTRMLKPVKQGHEKLELKQNMKVKSRDHRSWYKKMFIGSKNILRFWSQLWKKWKSSPIRELLRSERQKSSRKLKSINEKRRKNDPIIMELSIGKEKRNQGERGRDESPDVDVLGFRRFGLYERMKTLYSSDKSSFCLVWERGRRGQMTRGRAIKSISLLIFAF